MIRSWTLLLLGAACLWAADPQLTLRHLTGGVYVVEDSFYSSENSAVYIGPESVTVIGATWTPETAKLLTAEIRKLTSKLIREVVNTNYHPDRAGGNAWFRSIGAKVVSTAMTRDLIQNRLGLRGPVDAQCHPLLSRPSGGVAGHRSSFRL